MKPSSIHSFHHQNQLFLLTFWFWSVVLTFSQKRNFLVTFSSVLCCLPCLCPTSHQTIQFLHNVSHLVSPPFLLQISLASDLDYFRSLFPGVLPQPQAPSSSLSGAVSSPSSCPDHLIHSHAQKPSKALTVTFQKLNSKSSWVLTTCWVFQGVTSLSPSYSPLRVRTGVISVLRKLWCSEVRT